MNQKDLAERLGVSQGTVSRALRRKAGMKESVRRRILREAERSGYSIEASNHDARMMRRRAVGRPVRTDTICAVVFDEDNDSAGFGGRILRGMNEEGDKIGSEILMATRCRRSFPLIVMRRQVDGVIKILNDVEITQGITSIPVPWVSLFHDVDGVDLVTVDNFSGAREIGRLLARLGHRRLAYIGPDSELAHERLAGLRAGAAEFGAVVPDEQVVLHLYGGDEKTTMKALDRIATPAPLAFTALVGYNDFMADIALHYFRDRGLRVPGDVSVAGFDGALPSRLHEQTVITTVAIPLEEIGAAAVRLIEWRLQSPGAPRRKVVMDTALIEGETSGEPGKR